MGMVIVLLIKQSLLHASNKYSTMNHGLSHAHLEWVGRQRSQKGGPVHNNTWFCIKKCTAQNGISIIVLYCIAQYILSLHIPSNSIICGLSCKNVHQRLSVELLKPLVTRWGRWWKRWRCWKRHCFFFFTHWRRWKKPLGMLEKAVESVEKSRWENSS